MVWRYQSSIFNTGIHAKVGSSNLTCLGSRGVDTTKFLESMSLVTFLLPFYRRIYSGSLEIGSISLTSWYSSSFKSTTFSSCLSFFSFYCTSRFFLSDILTSTGFFSFSFVVGFFSFMACCFSLVANWCGIGNFGVISTGVEASILKILRLGMSETMALELMASAGGW